MYSLLRHLQKPPHRNRKMFFSILTRRLAESVEGLNSSLALAAGNLWPKHCEVVKGLKHLEPVYEYWTLKSRIDANFVSLCNSITHQLIVLESYPNTEDSDSLPVGSEKNFLVLGFRIFVGGVTSGVGFWPFSLRLSGPGSNRYMEVFHSSFYWKLG